MKLKLPKTIYVTCASSGDAEWFHTDDRIENLVGEKKTEVAQYELVKRWEVVKAVKLFPLSEPRKRGTR